VGDTWWTYKLKNSELDVHCVWKDVDSCELAIILSLKINFMAEVGYSGTPLIKKLGIKPEMKILVIHESGNYFDLLGVNISDQFVLKNEVPDLVHLFAKNMAVFTKKNEGCFKTL